MNLMETLLVLKMAPACVYLFRSQHEVSVCTPSTTRCSLRSTRISSQSCWSDQSMGDSKDKILYLLDPELLVPPIMQIN